jgi:transmembrane sensor
MPDLQEQLQQVGAAIDPWGAAEVERAWTAHRGRRRRRAVRRRAMGAGAGLAVVLAAGLLATRARLPGTTQPAAIRFADGSTATPAGGGAVLHAVEDAPARATVRLERGRAAFRVTKNPARRFRVDAGNVLVTVVGTAFTVERADGRTLVDVDEGRVRVQWAGGTAELGAGERSWFPRRVIATMPAAAPAPPPAAPALEPVRSAPRPAPRAPAEWARLAERGDYRRSYQQLRQARPASIDDMQELLLAADVARLSGHPADALPFLERAAREHASDSRAAVAAFTRGRILLNQLGRAAEAAASFADAGRLASDDALAQDALAREVEAWARAGDRASARARAEAYLRRFPGGNRAGVVKELGGLE